MYINTTTIIFFGYPEEYEAARAFAESNPDFREESQTTVGIAFKKEDTFYTTPQGTMVKGE